MSDPHSPPNGTITSAESGFLFSDWDMSEKGLSEVSPQFDGKIIARMPDLGSENFTQSIEKSKSPSFWENVGLSIASMIQGNRSSFPHASRQRFFLRFAIFGGIILLCGVGILFLEGENQPTVPEIADIIELVTPFIPDETPENAPLALILFPEANSASARAEVTPHQTVPAAPVEGVVAVSSPPPAHLPGQTESVWNRPAGDEYSPWNTAPRQPASSPATADNSPPPAPQSATVAMAPMIDMSMPISPYEQQLLTQANMSAHQPVDPFVQQNSYVVPGMIPMQERQENPTGFATANSRQSVSPPYHPQYLPPGAVQSTHPQYGQYNPQAVPPNMPISSGASTLPPQGHMDYYHQPHGVVAPSHAGEFYPVPPAYRRVY